MFTGMMENILQKNRMAGANDEVSGVTLYKFTYRIESYSTFYKGY
jgi:hypothetical protein